MEPISQPDTFLNYSEFIKLKDEISGIIKTCCGLSKKQRLEKLSKLLQFQNVFKVKGIQGITGLLKTRDTNTHIVYKVSVEIDRVIEHEYMVLNRLNTMRQMCPHFVGTLGMIPTYLSLTFIDNERKYDDCDCDECRLERGEELSDYSGSESGSESEYSGDDSDYSGSDSEDQEYPVKLFDEDPDFHPGNVLLLEYVNNISLYHISKYGDRNLIYSQVMCVLAAIKASQKWCKLTHYDLHSDNVLIRQCEPEALFVYIFDDYNLVVPTFGWYPVIIDMGSSFVDSSESNNLKTSINNYKYGLQSAFYDNLNDVHHFLCSLFSYLEEKSAEYDWIFTRIMWMFRWVPVFTTHGWKLLPFDIFDKTIKEIKNVCGDDYYTFTFLREWKVQCIEILNLSVNLPWKQLEQDSLTELSKMFPELKNPNLNDLLRVGITDYANMLDAMNNSEDFITERDLFFVVREIVETVHSTNSLEFTPQNIKKISGDIKTRCQLVVKTITSITDWSKVIRCIRTLSCLLSHIYYESVKDNISCINENYKKIESPTVLTFIKFFKQHLCVRYPINEQTPVYVWNIKDGTSKKLQPGCLSEGMTEKDVIEVALKH